MQAMQTVRVAPRMDGLACVPTKCVHTRMHARASCDVLHACVRVRVRRVEVSRLHAQLANAEARCEELAAAMARLQGDVDVGCMHGGGYAMGHAHGAWIDGWAQRWPPSMHLPCTGWCAQRLQASTCDCAFECRHHSDPPCHQ